MKSGSGLKDKLVTQALSEGFVSCRVCRPWDVPEVPARLEAFLDAGYHGQMGWMAERSHWRGDPAALWPEAQSVIMLAESYTPDHDPTEVLERPDRAAISVYAQNKDYHDLVKKRLKRLARWLIAEAGGEVKVFVDTAPVPEKALGHAAGLGWQGKHTNLVSRDWGNWAFIGSVFTHFGLACGHGRDGSLWLVSGVSGRLPDGCFSGAVSVGRTALHFLPDHRTQRAGG